jgi:hypothetical protein
MNLILEQHTGRGLAIFHRLACALVATVGTLAYASSFARIATPDPLFPLASAVGLAAAVSWFVFGAVLLIVTGARPSITAWVDVCLRTMAIGMVILSIGTAANIFFAQLPLAALLVIQLAALGASNVVMCTVFVARARRLGLPPAAAVTFWLVGLNATFAAILFALLRLGVFP